MLQRRLAAANAPLAERIDNAFACAFAGELATADVILAPSVGRLFEGYAAQSEPAQRRKPPHE